MQSPFDDTDVPVDKIERFFDTETIKLCLDDSDEGSDTESARVKSVLFHLIKGEAINKFLRIGQYRRCFAGVDPLVVAIWLLAS